MNMLFLLWQICRVNCKAEPFQLTYSKVYKLSDTHLLNYLGNFKYLLINNEIGVGVATYTVYLRA